MGAIARDVAREHDRIIVRSRRGYDHGVGAAPVGEAIRLTDDVVTAQEREVDAVLLCELDLPWIDIDADHAAPARAQQLHRELSDQSEADHDDRLAELRLGLPHTL